MKSANSPTVSIPLKPPPTSTNVSKLLFRDFVHQLFISYSAKLQPRQSIAKEAVKDKLKDLTLLIRDEFTASSFFRYDRRLGKNI
jgi:hypothetical protein